VLNTPVTVGTAGPLVIVKAEEIEGPSPGFVTVTDAVPRLTLAINDAGTLAVS